MLAQLVMSQARWPACLRAVIHQANFDISMETSLLGSEECRFRQNKCFKTGSVDAPRLWRMVIKHAFAQLVPLLDESKLRLMLECGCNTFGNMMVQDKKVIHFPLADNVWLVSTNRESLINMLTSLADMIKNAWLEMEAFFVNDDDN